MNNYSTIKGTHGVYCYEKGIVRTTLSALYSINKPVTGVSAADYNIEIRWGNQSISYRYMKSVERTVLEEAQTFLS